jgi:hypothetical protein
VPPICSRLPLTIGISAAGGLLVLAVNPARKALV